jgi:hypothetical protein
VREESPTCQSHDGSTNGSAAGKPTRPCQPCGEQVPCTTPRGTPCTTTIPAVLWDLRGVSRHRIACLWRVAAQAGLNGIRAFALAHSAQPEPPGKTLVLQLDALWQYLKKQRQKRWIGPALD